METGSIRYFLGGNTADGFFSLYDSFTDPADGDFIWILKGGPGCGKSTFMKKIASAAEAKGLTVERALCSGDPNSLDGIYIPALKTAYMDGTAPHSTEPGTLGADSCYLDLSRFYDLKALRKHKNELLLLKKENSQCYKRAYSLLRSSGEIRRHWMRSEHPEPQLTEATGRIMSILRRELGAKRRPNGSITRRFLSAYTCQGKISLTDSAESLCHRFCLPDSIWDISPILLARAAERALEGGCHVILCPDPLTPQVPEAVLLPQLQLGFLSPHSALSSVSGTRRLRLDARLDPEIRKSAKAMFGPMEKLCLRLENEAIQSLKAAKTVHDKLEAICNPYVDFDGVYALASDHITTLGLD